MSVDIIQSAGLAYKKTWDERVYLLPMFIIPLLIKFFFFTLAGLVVQDGNILRSSLIMVPAFFAEGWLLSHWVRTIVVGHRWPFRLSGDDQADMKQLKLRGRGVLSGSVAYTLINMGMAGYFSFFMSFIPADMNPEEADPSIAIIGVFMMIATFLLFRYIWFYIPMAVNTPPKLFIQAVQPLVTTFQMLGVWLVCVVPAIFLMQLIGGATFEAQENIVIDNLVNLFRIAIDMIKNLICTAGLTIVIMQLLGLKKK
jgi:hypothetical protein